MLKNVVSTVLLISICSATVQAHWKDEISKNEREAFCNFYARLEAFLTNLKLGDRAENFRFRYNKVLANVSRKFRRDFHKKWNCVAHEKDLKSKVDELYRACLKNSSSFDGRKKCAFFAGQHLENLKESLIATLAKAKKEGTPICNKIGMVFRRRRK